MPSRIPALNSPRNIRAIARGLLFLIALQLAAVVARVVLVVVWVSTALSSGEARAILGSAMQPHAAHIILLICLAAEGATAIFLLRHARRLPPPTSR